MLYHVLCPATISPFMVSCSSSTVWRMFLRLNFLEIVVVLKVLIVGVFLVDMQLSSVIVCVL